MFQNGYNFVMKKLKDEYVAKQERFFDDMRKALGVTTNQSVRNYMNGRTLVDVVQDENVRKVFRKYGYRGDKSF